jgi:5'-hydroxyaverantin dehydrogenase
MANIDVNLTGTYYTSWLALYYLRLESEPNPSVPSGDCIPSRDKALILVSSMVAYMDAPIAPWYMASKTGVCGLFRSIRPLPVDLRSKGSTHISCSLLAPWFVDTSFLDPMRAIVGREALDKHSSGYTSMDSIVTAASYCATNPDVHGEFRGSYFVTELRPGDA